MASEGRLSISEFQGFLCNLHIDENTIAEMLVPGNRDATYQISHLHLPESGHALQLSRIVDPTAKPVPLYGWLEQRNEQVLLQLHPSPELPFSDPPEQVMRGLLRAGQFIKTGYL